MANVNIQDVVNAQVEINRAVYAWNDFHNEKVLQKTEVEIEDYIKSCVKKAMKSLAAFREENMLEKG